MSEMDLLARIERLEATVMELRNARQPTMREARTCPACGGQSLLHFRQVFEQGEAGLDNTIALKAQNWPHGAPLEAYVCRGCAFVEWYARYLERVHVDGRDVVSIEPTKIDPTSDGPYR